MKVGSQNLEVLLNSNSSKSLSSTREMKNTTKTVLDVLSSRYILKSFAELFKVCWTKVENTNVASDYLTHLHSPGLLPSHFVITCSITLFLKDVSPSPNL